jgi:uncharacterized protein YbjT (DUF2867 family)
MKILLTGATGYIGKRILPVLIQKGYHVICCVRDKKRFNPPASILKHIDIIEVDLLKTETLKNIPKDIDGAYYLVHSMSSATNYEVLEKKSAENFRNHIEKTTINHLVYLSGIVNNSELSKHLESRKNVENELSKGKYHFTTLRAGIIIGSGSASFEIIRDLVEKLPIMITPIWLRTKCQPIAIADVVTLLTDAIFNPKTYDKSFDIGGPEILTYKQMLLGYAKVRGLKRSIGIVPVMTPKLSSYWLYFVTSTSYKLATALVHSMKIEVIAKDNSIKEIIPIKNISYSEALERTFSKIKSNEIASSWKDAFISGNLTMNISDFINIPEFGCFKDKKSAPVLDFEKCRDNIWKIGGKNGWYKANFLWKIRGFADKLFGGVGLRRGRTNPTEISTGDTLDFWRVLYANKKEGRLLLFAEMKLPGEAWLEFKIENNVLYQTATFRPKGLLGRLYWYAVVPFHHIVFKGMIKNITKTKR